MGKDDLIEAARLGNYPACEKILSVKPKKPGPFASLRRGSGGCNTRDASGYTALHYAALNGHRDIVELLLSYEASCNSADEKGSSPLHLASWAGKSDIVKTLLTHGPSIANVNLTNSDKETALHSAAQFGHLTSVKVLLEHGADPNIKNCKDETALDLAALYGRTETVKLLLETHPELVGPYTAYGGAMYCHTPLHLASRNGHKEVVQLILETGFDINVRTSRGTALHEAALCGKIDVVKILLEANINVELRDQDDKTVLSLMDELKTPRAKDIIHVILDHMGIRRRSTVSSYQSVGGTSTSSGAVGGRPALSPYDNVSLTQSLDSYSLDLDFSSTSASRSSSRCQESPMPRRPSWLGGAGSAASGSQGFEAVQPRPAKSVEDMIDRRISSLSTTSGCSDCTTATLQNAKSFGSSFFSGDEMTPRLLHTSGDDSTSLSSSADIVELPGQFSEAQEPAEAIYEEIPEPMEAKRPVMNPEADTLAERRKKMSLSVSPNLGSSGSGPIAKGSKPIVPAKPAHIRPGLKPVKIPTIDDKLLQPLPPKKPPRRNVSVSPVRTHSSGALLEMEGNQKLEDYHYGQECRHPSSKYVYSTKSGSKSFDEIDDILSEKPKGKPGCAANRKKNRRTLSSGADYLHHAAAIRQTSGWQKEKHDDPMEISSHSLMIDINTDIEMANTRLSCDELLSMSRSLHESEMSDTSSHYQRHLDFEDEPCQRCLLNSMSNRALLLEDCKHGQDENRFISQRQYKRKLRRDCPSYATLQRTQRRTLAQKGGSTVVEKLKVKEIEKESDVEMKDAAADDGSIKMKIMSKTTYKLRTFDDSEDTPDLSLELMEIPLSPTHYESPPTPDHEPPTPFEAETRIQTVIDQIRIDSNRRHHSKGTEIENCYLLPLGKTSWPERCRQTEDKATTMEIDMQPFFIQAKLQESQQRHHCDSMESPSSASSSLLSYDRTSLKLDNFQYACSDSVSVSSAPGNFVGASVSLVPPPAASVAAPEQDPNRLSSGSLDKSQQGVLSPFDEKEEWNKISKIIDSFGADIGSNIKKSTTPNNSPSEEYPTWKRKEKVLRTVSDWLQYIGLGRYSENFITHGFDHLDFVGFDIITKQDLRSIGIVNEQDTSHLIDCLHKKGPSKGSTPNGREDMKNLTVEEWLESLALENYSGNFRDNLFTSMDKVVGIWDDELTSILEIEKLGHRKRILLSLAGTEGIPNRFGKVQVDDVKEMEVDPPKVIEEDSESLKKAPKKRTVDNTTTTSTLGRSRKKKAAPQPPGQPGGVTSISTQASAKVTSSDQKGSNQEKSIEPKENPKVSSSITSSSAKENTPKSSISSKSFKEKSPVIQKDSTESGFASTSGAEPKFLSKRKKRTIEVKEKEFLAFKVKYYAKKITKEFRGNDTTKLAIESSRKSKGGRSRFLVLSEKDVKILKRDAKEEVTSHDINQVCCVVRDKDNLCIFGYVTATDSNQTIAHVFTIDSQEKASEILSVICEGFSSRCDQTKLHHDDVLEASKDSTPSPPSSASSSIASKTVKPSHATQTKAQSSQSRFRSDQLVSRMKQFFQGATSTERSHRRSQSPNPVEARRKRGGSVDNLLDELGDESGPTYHQQLSADSKKKSVSSKNLSLGPMEEVKITTV